MAVEGNETRPLVFVTVGTDHHPFHRLIRWVDGWLESGGAARARCFVQTGTSIAPDRAEWSAYLPYERMEELVREAPVVVCHGAGATISYVSSFGKIPVVVPRRKDLGEHVDPHQVLFSRRIAADGEIKLAEGEEAFRELLEQALSQGGFPRDAAHDGHVAEAVRRFDELVTPLLERPGSIASRRVEDAPGGAST